MWKVLIEAKSHKPLVCPKTGKYIKRNGKYRWLKWLFPVAGLVSLIWFVVRVVPKPSRATYPCQRMAAPLASGFLVWLAGLIGSTLAYRKARNSLLRSRNLVGIVCIVASVAFLYLPLTVTTEQEAIAAPHLVNSPIGTASGLHPGRVVWVHDPNATDWAGPRTGGHWWENAHTSQTVINQMMLKSIRALAGEPDISKAWDLLFRHFNKERGKENTGYQPGEKIMIKVNFVEMIAVGSNKSYSFHDHDEDYAICSPQIIHALLDQLVNIVGVAQSDITIGDPICLWCNEFYDMIHPDFPNVRYLDYLGQNGRTKFQKSTVKFYWSTSKANGKTQDYVLQSYVDAEYFINLASLKGHYNQAGITLCGKNHYGSLRQPNAAGGYYDMHSDSPYSVSGSGKYRNLVDLMGHNQVGGKTFLCLIDGLYGGKHASSYPLPLKWQTAPFNNDWPSSIFASQDQVAIDSVGFDFLIREWPDAAGPAHAATDDYLHEAALADSPPSGTFYDPERDGTRLSGLGVHEHWHNPTDKKYSRNLGTGNGIELVTDLLASTDGPVRNITRGTRYNYIQYAIDDAIPGDEIMVPEGIYHESINFKGKNITVNSAAVAEAIIDGDSAVVAFQNNEDANCVLAGFTITGGEVGIHCSGASPTITNCIISRNTGPGIRLLDASQPAITSCTIVGNFGGGIYSAGIPTITNSIIYYNDGVQIESDYATVTYSDVEGGWPGAGNINADPCFADANNGDYHLQSAAGRWASAGSRWVYDVNTSLCIDGGDPNSDWTAELWPNGRRINTGAYGGTPEASMSPNKIGNIADLNYDNAVDMLDFAALADSWLSEQVLKAEDLDRRGLVDFNDLGVFGENWLWEQQ